MESRVEFPSDINPQQYHTKVGSTAIVQQELNRSSKLLRAGAA